MRDGAVFGSMVRDKDDKVRSEFSVEQGCVCMEEMKEGGSKVEDKRKGSNVDRVET